MDKEMFVVVDSQYNIYFNEFDCDKDVMSYKDAMELVNYLGKSSIDNLRIMKLVECDDPCKNCNPNVVCKNPYCARLAPPTTEYVGKRK